MPFRRDDLKGGANLGKKNELTANSDEKYDKKTVDALFVAIVIAVFIVIIIVIV